MRKSKRCDQEPSGGETEMAARVIAAGRISPWVTLFLILLLMLRSVSGACADWAQGFGQAGRSFMIGAVKTDIAGNVYVAGSFDAPTIVIGGVTMTRIGDQDAFVAKLDVNGNTVWAKNFGGSGAIVVANGVTVDGSGNAYLAGSFSNSDLTTPILAKNGLHDSMVIKLDSNGNITWAKNFGGSGAYAIGMCIAADGTGNVYLGGIFGGGNNLTTPALTGLGYEDALAIKLDSAGNTVWAKNFGGGGAMANASGIAVDGSGNAYLAGFFSNSDLTTPALTKIGVTDALVIKLNSDGNTTWAKNFGGGAANTYGLDIALDGSDNVFLAGSIRNNLTTPSLTMIGTQDILAIKLDSAGTTTWAKNFGGSGANAVAFGIAVDGSGNTYLAGGFDNASLTTPALTLIGNSNVLAIKLDAGGNATRSKNFGSSGVDAYAYAYGIAVDGSGNVYLGGTFQGANLSALPPAEIGNINAFILQFTLPTQPSAATGSVSGIDAAGATLNGNVNDNGAATTVTFEYGTASSYGSNIAATTGGTVVAGAGNIAASVNLTGLTCNTTYHFRINAQNSAGTTSGGDATFTTGACPTYTVTYNGNGSSSGSVPTDVTSYPSGAVVTVAGNSGSLTRTGYAFSGWNRAANGSGTDYAPSSTLIMGSENVTLYAAWTSAPYTIVDALLALKIAVGLVTPQTDQVQRLDLAPKVNGVYVGNGVIDIADALLILRMAVGLS